MSEYRTIIKYVTARKITSLIMATDPIVAIHNIFKTAANFKDTKYIASIELRSNYAKNKFYGQHKEK